MLRCRDLGLQRAWGLPLIFAWLWACPAWAQVNIDAYRDYFLVGQFGEVCTMCEVIVLCEAGSAPPAAAAVPEDGDFTFLCLHTRISACEYDADR